MEAGVRIPGSASDPGENLKTFMSKRHSLRVFRCIRHLMADVQQFRKAFSLFSAYQIESGLDACEDSQYSRKKSNED